MFRDFLEFLSVVFLGLAFIILCMSPFIYLSAKRNATLINQKYGTQYSTFDFIWAGETIKTVIVGTGHNVNVTKK